MFDASIVIACRNEVNNLKRTVDSIMNSKNKLSYEIIVADDGSTDGSCDFININKEIYKDLKLVSSDQRSTSGTKNFGAKEACGKYLFFCDAHISVVDYWIDNLIETLEKNNADCISPAIKNMTGNGICYGATWNKNLEWTWVVKKPKYNVCEIFLCCGCTFGIKREVFEEIKGFDDHFKGYGYEDQELSLKLWLFGYRIILDSSVIINHLFKTSHTYTITSEELMYNFLCMVYLHFDTHNLAIAFNIARKNYCFSSQAVKIMLNEDLMSKRKEYFIKRTFDENYFFQKFNIPF
ncbi:glycosyltransferase family 2 protein [Clostridium estertheticum]|uniref:glycosyltransferase family 2 protein n=1 Tax=Clostridium estertheticum TaxID=238834 RepID=UPI001C6E1B57|nr:glycosyltransferase [Clostridium estertheticum]MBW9152825.1 glycosyltransferase [Clostridium estertheticum]WLC85782.1 glycosyltransferase [Clostridium estertheticum]